MSSPKHSEAHSGRGFLALRVAMHPRKASLASGQCLDYSDRQWLKQTGSTAANGQAAHLTMHIAVQQILLVLLLEREWLSKLLREIAWIGKQATNEHLLCHTSASGRCCSRTDIAVQALVLRQPPTLALLIEDGELVDGGRPPLLEEQRAFHVLPGLRQHQVNSNEAGGSEDSRSNDRLPAKMFTPEGNTKQAAMRARHQAILSQQAPYPGLPVLNKVIHGHMPGGRQNLQRNSTVKHASFGHKKPIT